MTRFHTYTVLMSFIAMPLLCVRCGTASLDALPKASGSESIKAGWEKYQIMEYEGSKLDFNDAVRVAPELVEGFNGLGWSNFRLQIPDQAVLQFSAGLARDTSDVIITQDMLVGLAFALFELNDLDGSDEAVTRAINLQPDQFDLQGDEYLHDHDGLVSSREVRLLQALVKFYKNEYDRALESMMLINPGIDIDLTQPGVEGRILKELENL